MIPNISPGRMAKLAAQNTNIFFGQFRGVFGDKLEQFTGVLERLT
jgi:hypothetical protein